MNRGGRALQTGWVRFFKYFVLCHCCWLGGWGKDVGLIVFIPSDFSQLGQWPRQPSVGRYTSRFHKIVALNVIAGLSLAMLNHL